MTFRNSVVYLHIGLVTHRQHKKVTLKLCPRISSLYVGVIFDPDLSLIEEVGNWSNIFLSSLPPAYLLFAIR